MDEKINELRRLADNVLSSGYSNEAYNAYQSHLISILSEINKSYMNALKKTTP